MHSTSRVASNLGVLIHYQTSKTNMKKIYLISLIMLCLSLAFGQTSQLSIAVSKGSDDMEEALGDNSIDNGSSDLELGSEATMNGAPQAVGVRFENVELPAGALVLNAYIQFTVDEDKGNGEDSELTIAAQDAANPGTFTTDASNVSGRATLANTVDWNIAAGTWGTVGEAGSNQRTPNLAALVSELIAKPDWNAGNAMAFIITGTGTKTAESYDGDAAAAPALVIDYIAPAVTTYQITESSDDMEESLSTNNIDNGSSDLELGSEDGDGSSPQIVGLRFTDIQLPANADVEGAFIQFTVDESKNTDEGNFVIRAQNDPNPGTFTTDNGDISSRSTFGTEINWTVPANTWENAGEAGPNQRTADISELLELITALPGWAPGNSVVFTITGTGTKVAESVDGDAAAAPVLSIAAFNTSDLSFQITEGSDDMEENLDDNSIDDGSSDLELGSENGDGTSPQLVGLRFANVNLAPGQPVNNAYIQFQVDESKNTDEGQFTIRAQADPNPGTFGTDNANISSRPVLSTEVSWTVPANTWETAGEAGENQRTADVTPLIEALLAQDGWQAGNAMVFTIEGTNTKVAESVEGDAAGAATLVVNAVTGGSDPLQATDFPIAQGSEWAYWTAEMPTDWFAVDFDDDNWPFGPGVLGANDFVVVTNTEVDSVNYFRKPFNVLSLGAVTNTIELGLRADDNAVVFINGIQVAETAPTAVNGIEEGRYQSFELDKSLLVEGENVIAVRVENIDGDDLLFDAYLRNVVPTFDGDGRFDLVQVGTYQTGVFDEGAAEIVAYDTISQQVFFTNADANTIGVLNIDDPANPTLANTLDLSVYGDGVNSVAVSNGIVAVAVEADPKQDPGSIVFFDNQGNFLNQVTAGPLPDMVTFNRAGDLVIVANEGEPNDEYTVDPEGSVSVIDISGGVMNATVTTIDFTAFNAQETDLRNAGVRIFGPNASVAQDLEPEYVAVAPNDNTAYVMCQENNALVVIDLNSLTATAVLPLGFKDHSVMGNGMDASNRSEGINITTWPTLGMYQPDAFQAVEIGGTTYLVTANEGDARDYDGFSEEVRVKDLVLDPTAYPNAADLQQDENLGRLKTTTTLGDTDGDGDVDQIYSYGARSFSIWNGETGALVYDSGDDFEQFLATYNPLHFNANNDDNNLKARSDDKGPEPEAVAIVERAGSVFALIGLERVGGIMVYDMTDPANPFFVNYVNNRNFNADPSTPEALDSGVEDIIYIDASQSPTGQELVVTANEVSGTVTLFSATDTSNDPDNFTLRLIHNNDGESKLVPEEVGDFLVGGAAPFKSVVDQLKADPTPSMMLSSGDNFLAGIAFNASLNRGDGTRYYDAEVLDALGYDALCIGNHDFDFGPDVLAKMINDFVVTQPPYLSANLDFSAEPSLQDLVDAGRIAPSTIVDVEGEQVGVIGLTTDLLPTVSSPRGVTVDGDFLGIVQQQVENLEDAGVNKIILITHLQSINNEIELARQLRGVDAIIAGGGDELLTNDESIALPGVSIFGGYPLMVENADGTETPIVTTPGEYRYVGNLVLEFDGRGNLINVGEESNPILVADVAPDDFLQTTVVDSIIAYGENLENNIIARTEVELDGLRGSIRTMETNQGNLIADAFVWLAAQDFDALGLDQNIPLIGFQNGGGIRNDELIPAGSDISEAKTFDMLPFSNQVVILEPISHTALKTALENSVSNVENVDGRFAQISGLEIVWDTAGTSGVDRIFSAELSDGTVVVDEYDVVTPDEEVYIVTNSFTAGGGDSYATFANTGIAAIIGASYQRALFDYLVDGIGGVITAADYPEGGEGRIEILEDVATEEPGFALTDMKLFPNPTQYELQFTFELAEMTEVNIRVSDMTGRTVRQLVNQSLSGAQHFRFNLGDLTDGNYFFVVEADGQMKTYQFVKM